MKKAFKSVGILAVMGITAFMNPEPARPLQTPIERIIAKHLGLADLRNYSYTVVYPKPGTPKKYSGTSEYLYSIISPNGHSLFASRREFDWRGNVSDTLIRRRLETSGATQEEIIPVPFSALFQFAVSSNERFMVIAGRLRDPNVEKGERDGIFLIDLGTFGVHRLTQYASLGQDIRSLNINDAGSRVIYEDKGTVMIFAGQKAQLTLLGHHPGVLPVLMPDGQGYLYSDRGQLILDAEKTSRALFSVSNMVGAIRVSPDGQFIAFGVDVFGDLSLSQLKICELQTLACIAGPKYSDWIAGRETFWIEY